MTAITKSYFDSEEITVFLLFPSLYSFVNIFFRYSIFSFPQCKNMLWPLHNSMIKCIADSDLFKQTQDPFIKLLLWLYYPCSALKLLKKYSVVHYAKPIAFKMWINNPHTAFFSPSRNSISKYPFMELFRFGFPQTWALLFIICFKLLSRIVLAMLSLRQ